MLSRRERVIRVTLQRVMRWEDQETCRVRNQRIMRYGPFIPPVFFSKIEERPRNRKRWPAFRALIEDQDNCFLEM